MSIPIGCERVLLMLLPMPIVCFCSVPNDMGPTINSMPPMLEGPPALDVFTIPTPLTTKPAPAIQHQLQLLEQQLQERMEAERKLAIQQEEQKAQRRAIAQAKKKAAAEAQQQAEEKAAALAELRAERKAAADAQQQAEKAALAVTHQAEARRQQEMEAVRRQAAHLAWQEAKKQAAAVALHENNTKAVAQPQHSTQLARRRAIMDLQAVRQRFLEHRLLPETSSQLGIPSKASAEAQQQARQHALAEQVNRADAQVQVKADSQAQAEVLPKEGLSDQALKQSWEKAMGQNPCEPWWTRVSDRYFTLFLLLFSTSN